MFIESGVICKSSLNCPHENTVLCLNDLNLIVVYRLAVKRPALELEKHWPKDAPDGCEQLEIRLEIPACPTSLAAKIHSKGICRIAWLTGAVVDIKENDTTAKILSEYTKNPGGLHIVSLKIRLSGSGSALEMMKKKIAKLLFKMVGFLEAEKKRYLSKCFSYEVLIPCSNRTNSKRRRSKKINIFC